MNISVRKLSLESLATDIPAIPEEAAGFYKHNSMVCLNSQKHKSGVHLTVHNKDSLELFEVNWSGEVTTQLMKSYADLVQATEFGACTIALLLIRELTEYTAIEQAIRGSCIDYYLVPKNQDENLIFNGCARLEVSGILKENQKNTVEARIRDKLDRLKLSNGFLTYVIVVEFSKPKSVMIKV